MIDCVLTSRRNTSYPAFRCTRYDQARGTAKTAAHRTKSASLSNKVALCIIANWTETKKAEKKYYISDRFKDSDTVWLDGGLKGVPFWLKCLIIFKQQ